MIQLEMLNVWFMIKIIINKDLQSYKIYTYHSIDFVIMFVFYKLGFLWIWCSIWPRQKLKLSPVYKKTKKQPIKICDDILKLLRIKLYINCLNPATTENLFFEFLMSNLRITAYFEMFQWVFLRSKERF